MCILGSGEGKRSESRCFGGESAREGLSESVLAKWEVMIQTVGERKVMAYMLKRSDSPGDGETS